MESEAATIQAPGLSSAEAAQLLATHGPNLFRKPRKGLWRRIRPVVIDPMFLLLSGTAALYFVLGKAPEGLLMIGAITVVTSISVYQDYRSSLALKALQDLVEPRVRVLRDGSEQLLSSSRLVPGDVLLLSEGEQVPADARVLHGNDLTVNESLLTGESVAVSKGAHDDRLFQGTLINSGRCSARVTETGMQTALGKLGKTVMAVPQQRTALQRSISAMVAKLTLLGLAAFATIFVINFLRGQGFLTSLLYSLTLAMAAIPEELPVAFNTFMALGAARLSRKGIITRNPQTIEHLGAVNVLCLDKTGTVTENRMQLRFVYDQHEQKLLDLSDYRQALTPALYYGVLASETEPFDEMEKAIWAAYLERGGPAAAREMAHEYPLEGQPPMMTHVYAAQGLFTAAAKGAPEKILAVSALTEAERVALQAQVQALAVQGFRVLGVASAEGVPALLPAQDDYPWRFEGLLALYDPPKASAAAFVGRLHAAGVQVRLLTGDHPETAAHIAGMIGIEPGTGMCTGAEVMQKTDAELDDLVGGTHLFARMHPEAKLRVVAALKRGGAIVAMTGDGVNDAPAIRMADVGIAMGDKGTELSRQSADLVLADDDLDKILLALEQGRKIYQNLRKVTRYILSIHLPIFLVAVVPLLLRWPYQNLFLPVHVIFLELIMGPTCSLFYEQEPATRGTMTAAPRSTRTGILSTTELLTSVLQGLAIGGGLLLLYSRLMQHASLGTVRTMVFLGLLCANVWLTFVNRSPSEPLWRSWRYPNPFALPVLLGSTFFAAFILLVAPARRLFSLEVLNATDVLLALGAGLLSVVWTEPLKAWRGLRRARPGSPH